jgi:glucose/arabinose dehydrogenase
MLLAALLAMNTSWLTSNNGNAAQVATQSARTSSLQLPAGFVEEVFVGNLLSPRTFAWTPDGRMLIVERGSNTSHDANLYSIRVVKDGALLPTRAYTRAVCGDGERGFLGLTADPNFAQNGFLYIYYTAYGPDETGCRYGTFAAGQPGPRNRISRITMTGDVIDPNSEVILVDNIASDTGIHNSGDLAFGADGYLYASTGDSYLSPNPSQLLDSLNGKILRIRPLPQGGYATEGNPYDADPDAWYCGTNPPGSNASSSGPCKEIFARGFRNPFRFTPKPNSNSLFVNDVGGGNWEEVSEVVAGGNYGFPMREGPCAGGSTFCTVPQPPSGYGDPIYAYPHHSTTSTNDAAIIGGAFYVGGSGEPWPQEYLGNYFFTDNARGFIRRLRFDVDTQTWQAVTPDFAPAAQPPDPGPSIIGLRAGPDGDLYYLTYMSDFEFTSAVHRIRYQPSGNAPPQAQASVSPPNGPQNTAFVFSAAGSADADGDLPLSYRWDFGDGTTITTNDLTTSHVFGSIGTKAVTLTVQDNGDPPALSSPALVNVFVGNAAPTATIALTNTTQLGRVLFYGGDTWRFGVKSASDDKPLPTNAFTWEVVFHHSTHTHPFLSNIENSSGQFDLPVMGETAPDVWYRVVLHVRDSDGQVTTVERDIYPATVALSLDTQPSGGSLAVDGATYSMPLVLSRTAGMMSALGVPAPQVIAGSTYTFSAWPQGGAPSQQIRVPTAGGRFVAQMALVTEGAAPTRIATVVPTATPTPINTVTPNPTAAPTPGKGGEQFTGKRIFISLVMKADDDALGRLP